MRDIITSPRAIEIQRRRRALRTRISILICFLILTIFGTLAYFSFDRRLTLNNIVIYGNYVLSKDDLETKVREQLSGRYFKIFSRANSFIYPKSDIGKSLIKSFPRIDKFSISRQGLNTLYIVIVERSGQYLYCGANFSKLISKPISDIGDIGDNNSSEPISDIGDDCYFVNSDGLVFDKAPYFSGNVYFKYYTSSVDVGNPVGSQILPVDNFKSLTRFIESLDKLGFKSDQLLISKEGVYNLYLLNNSTESRAKIIWTNDNDLDTILDNLSLSLGKQEFANDMKTKYDKLSYIDLRFKNKVLYKFQ